ncbi:cobyric acid synthase [Ottowia sp.]|uniref:cobyric acid synthase n=1 Tax=Ottowia sp. TaxID=1898956 RepID=UPI00345B5D9C
MVLGTSSGAGKSWIATALCRHYARQGLRVAPFKAQNMSNNARVVASISPSPAGGGQGWGQPAPAEPAAGPSPQPSPQRGEGADFLPLPPAGEGRGEGAAPLGEIGSAQYFQALAARAVPDVRMNPLLLKPEADTRSQVLLLGQVSRELSALPWRGRSERVWPPIAAALDALRAENDVVVIEGAGSPAEINLMASDVVNLRVARHADAACLLVTDIDRGGAFAHLYGTWALLPAADRARIRGFVLNKFRGDAGLLAPAPEQLQALTGVPTVAVVPMRFGHGLPEEDGVFDDRPVGFDDKTGSGADGSSASSYQNDIDAPRRIAIVAYPRISNLDEFQPLKNVPGLTLAWARTPAALAGADTIVLPGSKATAADLAWLRAQGLDAAIAAHAARGARVLGICGGLQMLGEALIDEHGVESTDNAPGLGLLPLVTCFERAKTVRHATQRFGALTGAWAALSRVPVTGYEIHSGRTVQHPAMAARGDVAREVMAGLAWQNGAGNVLGVYLHGLFEDAAVLRALFGADAPALDAVFDGLADAIEQAFAPGVLDALVQRRTPANARVR